MLRETLHNSHALLAFFALSNADVIIARSTLDEHQAGLYAGGLILPKAVLFLPQFVVVIAFPSMSKQGAGRQMHLVSLAAVLGHRRGDRRWASRCCRRLAVVFVGGPEYADLQGRLWVFAAARHPARDAAADDLQHRGPAAAARGAAGLGRARGAGAGGARSSTR